MRDVYGEIEHPTLGDLVRMIIDFPMLEDAVLFKADLAGAFTLLDFKCEDVPLMATQLTDDLILIHLTGCFGWAGTPFAFDVVTRVLRRLFQTPGRLKGRVNIYVDDILGITSAAELLGDLQTVRQVCTDLLGPTAMADNKYESGKSLVWIGWQIDLTTRTVTISPRCFHKALLGFLLTKETQSVPIRDVQKLASWAVRYSQILWQLKPFVPSIYAATQGMTNLNASRILEPPTRQAIVIWRIFLCAMAFKPWRYCRPFRDYARDLAPTTRIWFDGSLLGFGVSLWDTASQRGLVAGRMCTPFDLVSWESKGGQNLAEYICVVIGLYMAACAGYRDQHVILKGDSVTALTWGVNGRAKDGISRNATIVATAIGLKYKLTIWNEIEHLPGELNAIHDKLSRGTPVRDAGFDSLIEDAELEHDTLLHEIVKLCSPESHQGEAGDILDLWEEIEGLLDQLEYRTLGRWALQTTNLD
jgi:hypothetical protein